VAYFSGERIGLIRTGAGMVGYLFRKKILKRTSHHTQKFDKDQ
jgi:hypothetical protein